MKGVPVIALTSGEPAGIGPELCTKIAREIPDAKIVVVGDRTLLPGCPQVEHVALSVPVVPGDMTCERVGGNSEIQACDRRDRP